MFVPAAGQRAWVAQRQHHVAAKWERVHGSQPLQVLLLELPAGEYTYKSHCPLQYPYFGGVWVGGWARDVGCGKRVLGYENRETLHAQKHVYTRVFYHEL